MESGGDEFNSAERFRRVRAELTFLRADLENNAKACLAAHHPVIGGLGFFERKNLIHRGDLVELTEQKLSLIHI